MRASAKDPCAQQESEQGMNRQNADVLRCVTPDQASPVRPGIFPGELQNFLDIGKGQFTPGTQHGPPSIGKHGLNEKRGLRWLPCALQGSCWGKHKSRRDTRESFWRSSRRHVIKPDGPPDQSDGLIGLDPGEPIMGRLD